MNYLGMYNVASISELMKMSLDEDLTSYIKNISDEAYDIMDEEPALEELGNAAPEDDYLIEEVAVAPMEDLRNKKNPSLAEIVTLMGSGMRPYFYDHESGTILQLSTQTMGLQDPKIAPTKWLHPMMADRINERYTEIRGMENKIKDLLQCIEDIEENGTDLLI